LNSVDLPTFGRPTTTTDGVFSGMVRTFSRQAGPQPVVERRALGTVSACKIG
jgi:hypothetical protein